MAYFKKIPVALYDFTTKKDKTDVILTVPDLTARASISWDEETADIMTDVHIITETETPQSISYDYYGTSDYYWTIMYLNQKYDMLNDWPMDEAALINYCKKKYPDDVQEFNTSNHIALMVPGNNDSPSVLTGQTFLKVDPDPANVAKLNGVFPGDYLVTPYFPEGTKIVSFTSTELTLDKGAIVSESQNITVRIARPLAGMDGLHHYKSANGIIADELYIENEVAAAVYGTDDIIEFGLNEDAIPVTNYDYENELNEARRPILIIKPRYIAEFIKQFDRAMR